MITIETDMPVAIDSPDHLHPSGAARDNSTHAEFNRRLYGIIPAEKVRLLDLGCSGGGWVKSILDDGGVAIGIEGSDYSKVRGRAEWATIPANLFTADITEPFRLNEFDSTMQFNVCTAWEFLEHIAAPDLAQVFVNIRKHLVRGGLFLGSISASIDIFEGVALHQTVRMRYWWIDTLNQAGFRRRKDLEVHFGDEWVRGPRSAHPCNGSFFVAMEKP